MRTMRPAGGDGATDGFSTVRSQGTMQMAEVDSGTMKWRSPGDYDTMQHSAAITMKRSDIAAQSSATSQVGTMLPAKAKKDATYVPPFAHLLKPSEQATVKLDRKPAPPTQQATMRLQQESKTRQIEATLRRLNPPKAAASQTDSMDDLGQVPLLDSISLSRFALIMPIRLNRVSLRCSTTCLLGQTCSASLLYPT